MTSASDGGSAERPEFLGQFTDRATGVRAVIAVDDTTLGPGLGGVRWKRYPSEQAAVTEVRRLARIMTLKNAVADLPCGGAKSVIVHPEPGLAHDRQAVMEAFGRFVGRLGGLYVPGVDMGTSVADLEAMFPMAEGITCEDPSDYTAIGVFAGIEVALGGSAEGCSVVVQGVGHVGADLAVRLAKAGARVTVTDIDARRAAEVADLAGATFVAPDDVLGVRCDVLAPCAQARLITPAVVDLLQCRIVAGAANDVLSERSCADLLAARGIVYVPDFVINVGGAVRMHALRAGWDGRRLEEALMAIGERVGTVIEATATHRTPLALAEELASARLGRPVAILG
jgi:leucine dehydrogenase